VTRKAKRTALAVGVIALVVIGSFVHPWGRVKAAPQVSGGLLTDIPAPEPVYHALSSKCVDCHSSQTRWPAYAYVFPVSWLVERDVAEGRNHVDFSAWHTYSQEQKLDLLNRIATEARSGEMPPGQYSFIHRSSVLSSDEKQEIYAWAKAARKKIREQPTP
jgi:cytochrome c